jgi:type I restriction enzyme R subunit
MLKQAGKSLLASLKALLRPMSDWTQKEATQAEVKIFILDDLYRSLPQPPFTEAGTKQIAEQVYEYVWQKCRSVLSSEIAGFGIQCALFDRP